MSAKMNELVTQIETEVRAAADADAALLAGLRSVCLACDIPYGEVWVPYSERQNLYLRAHWHPPAFDFTDFVAVSRRYAFAPGVGLAGRVWKSRRPEIIEDLQSGHDFSRREIALATGFRAAVASPITRGNDPFAVLVFLMFKHEPVLLEMIGRLAKTVSREIAERWPHRMARTAIQLHIARARALGKRRLLPFPRNQPISLPSIDLIRHPHFANLLSDRAEARISAGLC